MNRKSRVFWSTILSFVLLFTLCISPHAALANTSDGEVVVEQSVDESKVQADTTTLSPMGGNEPEVVPLLLVPVAAYGFTSQVISSIFAAGLGWYVGASDVFKGSVNDKQDTSSTTYGVQYTPATYSSFPEFAGFSIETSATKHMEEAIVAETAKRIKSFGRFGNLRVYSSTRKPSQVMTIIDITSPIGGTVNRHLGNFLSGKFSQYSNPSYKNEWMDLSGYSIFLITDKEKGQYFHAHFTPTRLVEAETEYQRYNGEFDVQLFPTVIKNTKYQKLDTSWANNKRTARDNRGLLKDPNDAFPSIIPYK